MYKRQLEGLYTCSSTQKLPFEQKCTLIPMCYCCSYCNSPSKGSPWPQNSVEALGRSEKPQLIQIRLGKQRSFPPPPLFIAHETKKAHKRSNLLCKLTNIDIALGVRSTAVEYRCLDTHRILVLKQTEFQRYNG